MLLLNRVERTEWLKLSSKAHEACFLESREPATERFTFALAVTDETKILAYSTIMEVDSETVYMQHGGALPDTQKTINVKRVYKLMVDWLKAHYKRISTRIQNTNVAMLKLAMSEGLIIDGVSAYGRDVFLSLSWGFASE